jgi:uncharacterized protein (TIGR03084 family)
VNRSAADSVTIAERTRDPQRTGREASDACLCGLDELDEVVADLTTEHIVLRDVLEHLNPEQWSMPSGAAGWTVGDCVAHLAHTSDIAADTCQDGARAFRFVVPTFRDADAFVHAGVQHGRTLAPSELLAWWVDAAHQERLALGVLEGSTRVRWGLGMSAVMFARARLMEAWAHSLDVATGLGMDVPDSWRLRHVASLGVHALPYAFRRARRRMPAEEIGVVLEGPDGTHWYHGPRFAPAEVSCGLGDFARVAVRRLPPARAARIRASGAAVEALSVMSAYL